MFFFLSKTLNYFTTPLLIICVLFLLSVVLRRTVWKKRTFIAGLVLLIFLSNDFIANEVMHAWEEPVTFFAKVRKTYRYGILLTGVTRTEPGPRDRISFNRGADRVVHTFQLYKLGLIKNIIISGGSGRLVDTGVREADDIAAVLEMMGVRHEDIIIEDESHNTRENAVNSVNVLQGKATPAECLLITSGFHMRRSAACFAKLGWPMDTFSTDFRSHNRSFTPDIFLIPKVEALNNWDVLTKEWIGYIAYKLAGYI